MDDDKHIEIESLDNTIDLSDIGEISISSGSDTIDVSSLDFGSFDSMTSPFVISSTAATGSPQWINISNNFSPSNDFEVKGDAAFEGDIKWKGRSLGGLLEKIEDRLAILPDPDPEKLEKFAALKKAYDHYKMLERLIGEE